MSYRTPNSPLGIAPKENLELLKANLSQAFPVTGMACSDDLLIAIDEAHEKMGKIKTIDCYTAGGELDPETGEPGIAVEAALRVVASGEPPKRKPVEPGPNARP